MQAENGDLVYYPRRNVIGVVEYLSGKKNESAEIYMFDGSTEIAATAELIPVMWQPSADDPLVGAFVPIQFRIVSEQIDGWHLSLIPFGKEVTE